MSSRRFYIILTILGQEIRIPFDLPDGEDLPRAASAEPAALDPIARIWKGAPVPKRHWIFYGRRGRLVAEIPAPAGVEKVRRYVHWTGDVRATLREWGGCWDSDDIFDRAVRTAEIRRRQEEIERYTAELSRCRAAALRRAAGTDDVFIPYLHYRRLQGVIVRRDALAGHFDTLYDRAARVLHQGSAGALRIEREDATHVHFVRA